MLPTLTAGITSTIAFIGGIGALHFILLILLMFSSAAIYVAIKDEFSQIKAVGITVAIYLGMVLWTFIIL